MKVFLSYNLKDKEKAESIGNLLLHEGIDVWLDKWEINAGESISDRIEQGLSEVSAFVILMSPASMSSRWVRDELRLALQLRLQKADFSIIPILIEECEIHGLLKDYQYVDWGANQHEAEEVLLRALKSISGKPKFHPDDHPPKTEFSKIVCTHVFKGIRGAVAEVTEEAHGRAIDVLKQIDKQYYFAGRVDPVLCEGLSLKRRALNETMERWTLVSDPPIEPGEQFSFTLRYTTHDCLEEEQQEIPYAIEAPTDELVMIFDFRSTSEICDAQMVHIIGRTSHVEPTELRYENSRYIWRMLVPRYKDTYEFRFRWTQ